MINLNNMYDIIGDIHGHAEALKELLGNLGYKSIRGVWQHSNRKVIFVGDYIDLTGGRPTELSTCPTSSLHNHSH